VSRQTNDAGEQRDTPVSNRRPHSLVRVTGRGGLQHESAPTETPRVRVPLPLVNKLRVRIDDQQEGSRPEPSTELTMVRARFMKRTWADWGFRRGSEVRLAPLLLKALRAQTVGTEVAKREGLRANTVPFVLAHIAELVARTGLGEGQLADELAHDVNLWAWHWRTIREKAHGMMGGGLARKPTPISSYTLPPVMESSATELKPEQAFERCVAALRSWAEESPKRPTLDQKQVATALKQIWPQMRDKHLRAIRKDALEDFPDWRRAGVRRKR
jgi:hypothetical protein